MIYRPNATGLYVNECMDYLLRKSPESWKLYNTYFDQERDRIGIEKGLSMQDLMMESLEFTVNAIKLCRDDVGLTVDYDKVRDDDSMLWSYRRLR